MVKGIFSINIISLGRNSFSINLSAEIFINFISSIDILLVVKAINDLIDPSDSFFGTTTISLIILAFKMAASTSSNSILLPAIFI